MYKKRITKDCVKCDLCEQQREDIKVSKFRSFWIKLFNLPKPERVVSSFCMWGKAKKKKILVQPVKEECSLI